MINMVLFYSGRGMRACAGKRWYIPRKGFAHPKKERWSRRDAGYASGFVAADTEDTRHGALAHIRMACQALANCRVDTFLIHRQLAAGVTGETVRIVHLF